MEVIAEIIPLDLNTDIFMDEIKADKMDIDRERIFIQGIETISKILSVDKFPIKNKRIACENIFRFLAYIDFLIKKENDKGDTRNSILEIPIETWHDFFNKNEYIKYRDLLKELSIITQIPYPDGKWKSYTKDDHKCYRFRVHDSYIDEKNLALLFIPKKRKLRLLNNEIKDLDKRYVKTIKDLEINFKPAIEAEIRYHKENNTPVYNLRQRIENIIYTTRDRTIKYGKNVKRIFHPFSNVSRIAREHLSIKFHNIDIVNCQPLLLVYYLKQQNMEIDEDYIIDVENGLFYENFYDDPKERDATKQNLYQVIFFGFNPKTKNNKKFKELYPLTHASLSKIAKEETTLASRLQNCEANIFNNIKPKCSKNYFTLHDAIYFSDTRDIAKLKEDIIEKFSEYNITPKIKINY